MSKAKWGVLAFAGVMAQAVPAAQAQDQISVAMAGVKPLIEMRWRYEGVKQVPFAKEADALTWRTRFGFETAKAWETIFLIEGEGVIANEDYNSTINGKTTLPTVADPRGFELNRFQLTNTSFPATQITVGRQRMIIDDQRFVGNVGWRQNEQTLDAVRVVNRTIDGLALDFTYADQVNRVFGNRSPQGRFHGDQFLLNAGYQTIIGKITAFTYLVEFREALGRNDSTQTYGFRYAGVRPVGDVKIGYVASFAYQEDYKRNAFNYSEEYYLGELSATFGPVVGLVGYEELGGTGTKGFATPLATLHKFQGWADKFLATPVNGIKDLYATLTYTKPAMGPFINLSATAAYHVYDSERLSIDYGDEINIQLAAKYGKYTFTAKFADYDAELLATDTRKVWFQVEYVY